MSIKTNTFALARSPLVGKDGMLTWTGQQQFQLWNTQLTNALDEIGNFIGGLSASATVTGHGGTVGTILQNIDSTGILTAAGIDFSRNYVNQTLNYIADTTLYKRTSPNQVTGAGRAYTALDPNSKLPGVSATPNMQLNSVNFATVVGVDLGSTAGASIYGAGGAGTSWTAQVGTTTTGPYPAGSISGLAYSTTYTCWYDSINSIYVATTTIPAGLNDYYVYVGTFTTPASGGGGGAAFSVSMQGTAGALTVQYVTVTNGGNFTGTPSLTFSGGGTPTRQASGYATMSGSAIASVTVTDPGAGYSSAPTLTASGGTSGASGGGGSTGTIGGRGALAGLTA